jgi:hypothetical protein
LDEHANDEDEFDPEAMLAGIPDEDLDEESRQAKRRAQERKRNAHETYTKNQSLADVLMKTSENILDYVLERNLLDAEVYIRREEGELRKMGERLKLYTKQNSGEESDFSFDDLEAS